MYRLIIALTFSLAVPLTATAAPMCATPQQVDVVRAALVGKEPGPLFGTAASLKLPEAVVASALAKDVAHGVAAEGFPSIWKSIEGWDDALTLITKGADVFEISGRAPQGEPSKRSKYFNLTRKGDGLAGHLRPDLYSAIYVFDIPGKKSTLRGVAFYDQAGEPVMSVFVPGEGVEPPPAIIKQFELTRELVRAMPAICP